MVQTLLIGGAIVVALLTWTLLRHLANDRIRQFTERRRGISRFVSLGEFVDGSRHIPVSLAISRSAFYYENSAMQASLDLDWIQEVEYSSDLATGHHAGRGRVMSLRCWSQTFEFILPADSVRQWQMTLPPRYAQTEPAPDVQLAGGVA